SKKALADTFLRQTDGTLLNIDDLGGAGAGLWEVSGGHTQLITDDTIMISPGADEKMFFRDTGIFIQSTSDGNLLIEADDLVTIGVEGDIILGGTVEADMYPQSSSKINLGTTTNRFGDIFFGNILNGVERVSDPDEPIEGTFVVWMSNGAGKGDDGDILMASQAGGTTKYSIVFDHSAGSAW
ncbi:unnamed protein product, partial [marine sediment metagenome]